MYGGRLTPPSGVSGGVCVCSRRPGEPVCAPVRATEAHAPLPVMTARVPKARAEIALLARARCQKGGDGVAESDVDVHRAPGTSGRQGVCEPLGAVRRGCNRSL